MDQQRQLHWTQPIFMDFEASSLDLVASYPIEVGLCMADGSLHSWLIKPHVLWRDWSESAEAIHGISREQLLEEGQEIDTVIEALDALVPEVAFCDAWTFDSFWLHRLYHALHRKPRFHLESVSMMLQRDEVALWSDIRRSVINDLGLHTHRAANDACILRETWRRVVSQRATSESQPQTPK